MEPVICGWGAEAIAPTRQRGSESMPATPQLLRGQHPGRHASIWSIRGGLGNYEQIVYHLGCILENWSQRICTTQSRVPPWRCSPPGADPDPECQPCALMVAMISHEETQLETDPNFPQINKRWGNCPHHTTSFFGSKITIFSTLDQNRITKTVLTLLLETNKNLCESGFSR